MRRLIILLFCLLLLSWMPAHAQTWPHEPAGATVIIDSNLSSVTGWSAGGTAAYCQLATDTTTTTAGTASPTGVLVATHPSTLDNTTSGCALSKSFNTTPPHAVYFGFWWKPVAGFQGYPSGQNKVVFLWTQEPPFRPTYMNMQAPGYPAGSPPASTTFHLITEFGFGTLNCHLTADCQNLPGNINNPEVTLDQWHLVEVCVVGSTTTTSQDGVLRWWMDGTSIGDFSTVNWPAQNFGAVEIDQAWDGSQASGPLTNAWTGQHKFDHYHLSAVSNCTTGDTTAPAIPTGVMVTMLTATMIFGGLYGTLTANSVSQHRVLLGDYSADSATLRTVAVRRSEADREPVYRVDMVERPRDGQTALLAAPPAPDDGTHPATIADREREIQ